MTDKIQKRNLLGRPLEVEEVETLEQLSKFHRYPDYRLRALGLLALNSGRSVVDSVDILRVSDRPVYNGAKGWRDKGLVGILDGHKGGAPVKLTAEILDVAAAMARQEPLTLAKIAARIAERFPEAPSFSLDRLSIGLKARGLSFKRNRLSLKKRDESLFRGVQDVMSQLQQAAQEGTIELLYFDEAGFSCLPNVQRSGSPLGQPHTANASLGRKRVNAMGALDYTKGKLQFELFEHNVRREHVIPFFDHLAKSSDPDKFTFLTLDKASIHKTIEPAITQRWQADHKFFLLYLPPYSPELNLIEILWKHAKYPWRDFTSWTPATLVREVQTLLASFGTKFHISFA